MIWRTGRGGAKHHGLCSGDAEVPDPVPMAHVLPEQLTQSPGACGGLETGDNLQIKGREVGVIEGKYVRKGTITWILVLKLGVAKL